MAMASKVAAGFIIYRNISSQIEYLLLQTSYGCNHWTPPKGHVDPGETELVTAYRETFEEAGFAASHLRLVDGFQKVLQYDDRGVSKRVVYWLAELINPQTPVVLSNEHQDYKWLTLDLAKQYAGYSDMQQALSEASSFVKDIMKL